jgi:hypothetical protein
VKTTNGQVNEEIEVQLTMQTALRVIVLKERQDMAREIMGRLITLYKELGDKEEYALNMTLTNLCETNGRTLPHPYEFKLDVEGMKIIIRKKEDNG